MIDLDVTWREKRKYPTPHGLWLSNRSK